MSKERRPVKRLTGTMNMGGFHKVEDDLDEGIKPLVLALNRHGFRTCNSCEGDTYLTAEVSFSESGKPRRGEISKVRKIIRKFTRVPYHLETDKKGNVSGVVFRGDLSGQVTLPTDGRDTKLAYMAVSEGQKDESKFIREKLLDDSFWEK